MSSGSSGGSIIGAVVGAVIGGILAVPTLGISVYAGIAIGASVGSSLGTLAGGLYDQVNTNPIRNEQETINQFFAQTSSVGIPIPQVLGHERLSGNVLYIGERFVVEHETNVGGGNKGGSPRATSVTKTYDIDLSIGICDTRHFGRIAGIRKIWRDSTLWYDANVDGIANYPEGLTFHNGDLVGVPSPMIEAVKGAGAVPGWPLLARVDIDNYDMGNYPRVPIFSFQLYQEGFHSAAHHQLTRRPTDGTIWVAAPGVNAVHVFDGTLQDQTDDIDVSLTNPGAPTPVYSAPYATVRGFPMGWENTNDALWIAHPRDYQLKRIDAATKLVTHTVSTTHSLLSGGIYANSTMYFCAYNYLTKVGYLLRVTPAGVLTTITCGQARNGHMQVATTGTGIWVTDNHYPDGGGNSNALRLNASNTITHTVVLGTAATSSPVDIVVTPDTDKWVLDAQANTVIRIDATPVVVATIALSATPLQLAIASDDYVWACTTLNGGTVYRINPATNTATAYESLPLREYSPAHRLMTPGPSGAMWVLSMDTWTTQRFGTDGVATEVPTNGVARGMVAESTTHLWTSTTRGQIQRVTDAGALVASPSLNLDSLRLKSVLMRLGIAVGIPQTAWDFSLLTANPMVATKITTTGKARDILEALMLAYQFFVIESNLGLKCIPRKPGAVVETIDEGELDAHDADQPPDTFLGLQITPRLSDEELPQEMRLSYPSATRQYQHETQTHFVSSSRATGMTPQNITTSIVLTQANAKKLVEELHNQLWLQRTQYAFQTNRDYAFLEPGDRVTVTSNGIAHAIILSEIRHVEPGIMQMVGRGDPVDVLEQLSGFGGSGAIASKRFGRETTVSVLLNLPALYASDQAVRYHIAFLGQALIWAGASLSRSIDGGTSYTLEHASNARAIGGTVVGTLASTTNFYTFDDITTFDVILTSSHTALISVSDAQLFAGSNLAMVGNELLAFGTVTVIGAKTYRLSHLLRGRQGTEWACSTHGAGEMFVVVTTQLAALGMAQGERGVTRQFKTVTDGEDIGTVTPVSFAATSENLTPWTVGYPTAVRTGNDWILECWARSRFAGQWTDGVAFGYDSDLLAFRVTIYADGTYTVLKRTIDVAPQLDPEVRQTVTYLESQQNADFGSPQSTIFYRIAQISSYGAGRTANLVGV